MKFMPKLSDVLFWVFIFIGVLVLFLIPLPVKDSKFIRLKKQVFSDLKYPYALPTLKFTFGELEPNMDEQTVALHYTKHHQGYVDKLNAILAQYSEWQSYPLEDLLANLNGLPEKLSAVVKSHGGGHFNHTLFWSLLSKKPLSSEPSGPLLEKINGVFGSFEKFKQDFLDKALGVVGSGWVWLCVDDRGNLKIVATYNHESPLVYALTPILVLDVWEHAYYLKYQNRRADFVAAWWNLVEWREVEAIYNKSLSEN